MPDDANKQQMQTEKESFQGGMDDRDLMAQITSWVTEAQDFHEKLKQVMDENLLYYKGHQTGVDSIAGKTSRAVENRVFMAVETTIPIATSRLPDAQVVPGAEDSEQEIKNAGELQDILNYQFERVQIQDIIEKYLRDILVKRYGVLMIHWDKPTDDVGIMKLNPKRVRFPKYGLTVDEMAFVDVEFEMSYKGIEDYFDKATAEKVRKQGKSKDKEQVREGNYSVHLCCTNEYWVWYYQTELLKKEPNPYYDFENKGRNFFDRPKKPFIIKSLFETEDSLIGDTDYIQQTKPIQDNINIRKRQIENIIGKTSNPILLIDSEVMTDEEAEAITNEEGLVIIGPGAARGDLLRYENPGQVPGGSFNDLQLSRNEFDNIWGVHSTTRGERQGRETAAGRNILREGDLGRIDLIARKLDRTLDETAEWFTQLIKLFYTEDKAFTIQGTEGVQFIKGFNGTKVGANVKPMVRPGSTLKEDEYAIKQNAILLWQNKAIGLETLYKMIKLPNIKAAMEDYNKTFGQQQQAAPPPTNPLGI